MVDAVRDAFGETPEQVLADAGYCSEPNLQALKERDIDGYVSLAREGTAVMDPDRQVSREGRMAKKLASEEGRRRYARRKWMGGACRLRWDFDDSASGAWRRSRPNGTSCA